MIENISGYPKYHLCKSGDLWSFKSNRYLKLHTDSKRKYPYYSLTLNGVTHHIMVHRLLAFVYLGLPSLDSELEVDHRDRDINNFSLDNLKVMSKKAHKNKTTLERGQVVREKVYCKLCYKKLDCRSSTKLCKDCTPSKTKNYTLGSIEDLIRQHGSWVKAAKSVGLSDNGLRKKYKTLGGDPKTIKMRL